VTDQDPAWALTARRRSRNRLQKHEVDSLKQRLRRYGAIPVIALVASSLSACNDNKYDCKTADIGSGYGQQTVCVNKTDPNDIRYGHP
jgi:tRNA G46 methylase TrmB